MAAAAEGVISVSYRPLTTMDELHVLLLAAVSVQTADLPFLEQVFSLPSNVVATELAVLEAYGLTEKADGKWMATRRGQQIAAVRAALQNRGEAEVRATARQWRLGPGEFAVDEMIRDKKEIDALARDYGITDERWAETFLGQRRQVAESFETFVIEWPLPRPENSNAGDFGEDALFNNLRLAESDVALQRLKMLLATRIDEVLGRSRDVGAAKGVRTGVDTGVAVSAAMVHKGQDVMKRFDDASRTQRMANKRICKMQVACESLLVRQWLSTAFDSLLRAFDAEPAAFLFKSTVPYVEPAAPETPSATVVQAPPVTPKTKQEKEGVLRLLFRWLFQ